MYPVTATLVLFAEEAGDEPLPFAATLVLAGITEIKMTIQK
ncbi:hypothetical protein PI124_g21601 [Phytophthora idaei]|nr:hypothetical protein PI126_g21381 [Phytophthora idaei]KAG3233320.1 hypothetical protein PI124_g21601 [Phytophthora idaei]